MTNNQSPVTDRSSLSAKPLLRWAGGKRLIVRRLLDFLPSTFGIYFEPMVGSGALFFALCPEKAVLADVNPELINFYKIIKKQPHEFYRTIQMRRASKMAYYTMRDSCPSSPLEKAARFFYLIRLSWNGLYRVNREGKFNVPFGGRRPRELLTLDAILSASKVLKDVRLLKGDFEKTTELAGRGDLVYFDPPYPKGATSSNGFDRYHQTKFTLEHHKRLFVHVCELVTKGVNVLVTEAAVEKVLNLYESKFHIHLVESQSLIAADSKCRGKVQEAVITSYPLQE